MEVIPKKWGEEHIIHNDEDYCGKLLVFMPEGKFSMHFHMKKKETWYISKGKFVFTYIDTEIAEKIHRILKEGDVVEIPPGMPHQLKALEESEIFEVSTQHFDDDSYRVEKGDSQ